MNAPYKTYEWMTATPSLDSLTLLQMALPGTHNAGSDWQASYPLLGPPRHWLACQHNTFFHQLHHGARALDIRLDYEQSAEGLAKFRLHHNGHRNSRTLGHLVTDVNDFLEKHPDEFIVLDFHALDGENFDFAYFNQMIIHFLGMRIIPRSNHYLPIEQLKQISPRQRIVVAAQSHRGLNESVFIGKIEHEWTGESITNAQELHQFITQLLKKPSSSWEFWSLSATSYSALGGPVDIHDQLNEWFDPGKSNWAQLCNIINVDFIEESRIVDFCRTANLNKVHGRSV